MKAREQAAHRRVSTGVPGLDIMLDGGLYEISSTLVAGAPGTGKTTLGMHFLLAGIKAGEPGILVSFEEFPASYYRDAASVGFDLGAYEKSAALRVIFTSPEIFKAELEKEMGLVDRLTSEMGAKRIFIDPITYFRFLAEGVEVRRLYNGLVNGLKRAGLTSMMSCELARPFGHLGGVGRRMPFIVDNILVLKYVELDSRIRRGLLVLKSRGSDHHKEIREYSIGDGGITIGEKFEDREGILSEYPHRIYV